MKRHINGTFAFCFTMQSLIRVPVRCNVTPNFPTCTLLIGDSTHRCNSKFSNLYCYWRPVLTYLSLNSPGYVIKYLIRVHVCCIVTPNSPNCTLIGDCMHISISKFSKLYSYYRCTLIRDWIVLECNKSR